MSDQPPLDSATSMGVPEAKRQLSIDDDTLMYPAEMAARIGLSKNEINALKTKGCPFYGKKTTVNFVRRHLFETMKSKQQVA